MIDLPEGEELSEETALVLKKVNEEERRILGVVLEPDGFDLHKDFYEGDPVAKACEDFNEQCMQANVQHAINVDDGVCIIEKSFIQPVDCMIGEQAVKAGTWLQQWKVNSDVVWEAVKKGTFTGFSVGCNAVFEDLE